MAGRNSYDINVERGISQRHELTCPAKAGKRCTCKTRAFVATWTADRKRRYSPTVRTLDAARRWRLNASEGRLDIEAPDDGTTLRQAWRDWHRAVEAGSALTRGGDRYRQTTVDDYDTAMRQHVLGQLGELPLDRVDRRAVQRHLDQLTAAGVSPSRLHSAATALRALMRWASKRDDVHPLAGLELPRVPTRKPTILAPGEVARLLALLPEGATRSAHAVAAYTGARALEVCTLTAANLDGTVMQVGEEQRKTAAALRSVPIVDALGPYLQGLPTEGRLFGTVAPRSVYSKVRQSATTAWKGEEQPPTLHVLRHNWVSWMLAAGVPLPAVQKLSGHKTPMAPGVTLAVYGHALDDHVESARRTMNAWLAGQS